MASGGIKISERRYDYFFMKHDKELEERTFKLKVIEKEYRFFKTLICIKQYTDGK